LGQVYNVTTTFQKISFEEELKIGEIVRKVVEVERVILLQSVDNHWIDHIDAMDQLRQGIGLRAIGQIDPVIAYKMEGFDMFDEMNKLIREDTVSYLFNIQIEVPVERKAVVDVDSLESPDMDGVDRKPSKSTPEHVEEKIGRNEEGCYDEIKNRHQRNDNFRVFNHNYKMNRPRM